MTVFQMIMKKIKELEAWNVAKFLFCLSIFIMYVSSIVFIFKVACFMPVLFSIGMVLIAVGVALGFCFAAMLVLAVLGNY